MTTTPAKPAMPVLAELKMDTSRFQEQLAEITRLLAERFPEGIPDDVEALFLERIERLLSDPANFVFGKGVTAPLADGTHQIVYTASLDLNFEALFTAARTGNFEDPHTTS